MIFGSYPCCDGHLALSMPDRTPAYMPEDCPHCGAKVWHRFSRVQSMSWTESDFLAQHVVDCDAKIIEPRPGTEAERFDRMNQEFGNAVASGAIDLETAIASAALSA